MYPPSKRAEGIGIVLTASVLGALGGPLLVSAAERLASTVGTDPITLSWALGTLVLLPSALLILLVRPDPKAIGTDLPRFYTWYQPGPGTSSAAGGDVSIASLLTDPKKLAIFVASAVSQGQMVTLMALNSLLLAHHGHAFSAISAAVAVHMIGMFGLSIPLGRLADRLGHGVVLLIGLGTAAIGAILLPVTLSYAVIVVAIFLVGLGWSCVNVSGTALLADLSTPEERGRTIGANDTFSAVTGAVFPLLGGFVVQYWGFGILSTIGAIIMLLPVYFLFTSRDQSRNWYRPAEKVLESR
jgi:MFS family permease